jgi:hypothetical protein
MGGNVVLTGIASGDITGALGYTPVDVSDTGSFLTAHPSISAAASSDNSGRTYIQDVLLDSFGHVTGLNTSSEDADTIYTLSSFGVTATSSELNQLDGVTLGSLASLSSVNAATITDNSVGAAELNVVGNGTATQFLRSDTDGSFTWAVPTDTDTTYSVGSGISLSGTTFSVAAGGGLTQTATGLSHTDTSSQASVDNNNGNVIQDVFLDTYGHITGIGSTNLDSRYNNYSLPTGTSSVLGGFKIGYSENGKNYPVEVLSGQMFVSVPWTDVDTIYTLTSGDITGALGFSPISTETDDQTLDEVLAQGNSSELGIDVGAITGSALTIDTNTLFVDSTNNRVGIGTTSPSDKLEVYANGADVALRIHEDAGTHQARLHLRRGGSDWEIINDNNLTIESEGSEKMRITTTGNVGIGTTSPYTTLQVGNSNDSVGISTNVKLYVADGGIRVGSTSGSDFGYRFFRDSSSGDLVFIGDQNGNTNYNFQNYAGTSLLRIKSDGNVGIGTTSPSDKLDVYGNIKLVQTSNYIKFANDFVTIKRDGTNNLYFNAYGGFKFYDTLASSERMRIDSSGNVGIGTTSPSYPLHVVGSVKLDGVTYLGYPQVQDDGRLRFGDGNDYSIGYNSADDTLRIADGNSLTTSPRITLDSSGNVGIGTTSPVEKLTVPSGSGAMLGFKRFYSNAGTVPAGVGSSYSLTAILNDEQGTTLTAQFQYKFYLTTIGTDTYNSSVYIVYRNGGDTAWVAHRVSSTGLSNNHPELTVSGNNALIFNDHATAYFVAYRVESTYSGQDKTGPQLFGSDYMWTRDSDTLYYMGGGVGIGTTTPDKTLVVSGADSEVVINDTNSTPLLRFRNNGETSGYIEMDSSQEMKFHTGGTSEAVRIDASGNVGIGATSPSQRAVISSGNTAPFLNLTTVSSATLLLSNSDTGYGTYFASTASGIGLIQQRRQTSAVYYDLALNPYGGNVGIGTAAPNYKLDIAGNVNVAGSEAYITFNAGGSHVGNIAVKDESGYKLGLQTYNSTSSTLTTKMVLDTNGNVGIGTTSPASTLDILGGDLSTQFRVSNTSANSTIKYGAIVGRHYTNAEENVAGMLITSSSSNTGGTVSIGGGISAANAVNNVVFYTAANNTTLTGTERMRISSTGAIKFNNYGAGTFTGTVTQKLGVDSSGNVIEMPIGAGPVDGSGTANYLARWIDSDTLGIGAAYDNGTNVGIGTTSPAYKLEIADDTDSTVNLLRLRNTDTVYSQSWDFQLDTSKDLVITGGSANGGVKIVPGSRGFTVNGNIKTTFTSQVMSSRKFTALDTNGVMLTDSGATNGLSIANGGNATFSHHLTVSGNLTVNGTTTTLNSTTLQVYDKNIELGTVATPTNTTADGGGITLLAGSSESDHKTIKWINSTDAWTFSNKVSTSEITTASGTLTLNPAGGFVFLPSGKKLYGSNIGFGYQSNAVSAIKFLLGPSIDNPDMRIERSSSNLLIQNEVADGDILFKGSDGGSTITALTLDMSEGGNATFSGSETNFASGSMLDWANGDARIIEGAHSNNYSLSFQTFDGSSCSTKMNILGNGNVGIGTTTPCAKLEVNGHFAATTKSFIIPNPKKGGRLQYGVVETDEHSVYIRGKSNQNLVELPEEWEWLVDEDSVTVQLTSIGQIQQLFVTVQNNKYIKVCGLANNGEYNYVVYGTRKDVDPLQKNLK